MIPIYSNDEVIGVLDVDSEQLNYFDEVDKEGFQKILDLMKF